MYIIAGDSEVLRDEIIYLAHRAAYPSEYPVRESVLKEARRQQENVEKFTKPTKVHLQVFDGMCHVPTVFMFTKSVSDFHLYSLIVRRLMDWLGTIRVQIDIGIRPACHPIASRSCRT